MSMDDNLLRSLHDMGQQHYASTTILSGEDIPEEWKTIYYKEYTRFSSVPLPHPNSKAGLAPLIEKRTSQRDFTGNGISLEELANFLYYTCGENIDESGRAHRAQASAGRRYPIEVYPIVRSSSSSDLIPGVYHYNVKQHSLEYLWPEGESATEHGSIFQDDWANSASVVCILTSVFWRSQIKYRTRSYRYSCMEAGGILQNAYLYASDTDLKVVGYGGIYDDRVEALLRLNTEVESTICSFLVGK